MIKNRWLVLLIVITIIITTGCSNEVSESDDSLVATNTIEVKSFQYDFEPSVIKVKLNETTKLVLTTDDVKHGFKVKELDIDVKINEGEETVLIFTPTLVGEFKIICSVFCGSGHKEMTGTIIVTE